MDQIDLRAATAGVVAGLLSTGVAAVAIGLGGPRPALVLAVAQLGLLIAVGALVATLQRRRFGLFTRTAALRTALTAGGAGLVVVLVLEAIAASMLDGRGIMPLTVLLHAFVWLGGPALGCVLVRPGAAHGAALGVAP